MYNCCIIKDIHSIDDRTVQWHKIGLCQYSVLSTCTVPFFKKSLLKKINLEIGNASLCTERQHIFKEVVALIVQCRGKTLKGQIVNVLHLAGTGAYAITPQLHSYSMTIPRIYVSVF